MTKKDYELIAKVIKEIPPSLPYETGAVVTSLIRKDRLVARLGDALLENNSAFDWGKFWTSCHRYD